MVNIIVQFSPRPFLQATDRLLIIVSDKIDIFLSCITEQMVLYYYMVQILGSGAIRSFIILDIDIVMKI